MKKLFLLLLPLLFISCNFDTHDDVETFPIVDYSSLVKDDKYVIPSGTEALTIFNCFYTQYGYGEFNIEGTYTHTESAYLNNVLYEDTITKTLKKIIISNIVIENTSGSHISGFYITFITDKNEILEYCYQWQYHNTNSWKNTKTDGTIIIMK